MAVIFSGNNRYFICLFLLTLQQVTQFDKADINASNVKVTDEEISAYEAKYPKLFKAEGLVKLSYTYFF